MTSKYVHRLRRAVLDNDLSGIQTKIFFFLIENPLTAAMIARQLEIPQPTVSKAVIELQKLDLLRVDRIEGRNKFLIANLDTLPSDD